ncbi:OpgC domain-containing protein [Bosea vestrisii]|nr:OpgC domain-containing protein [Bosea vestrisii]WID95140.1 OpgC domain-containing protein [Bosea vestrisii]
MSPTLPSARRPRDERLDVFRGLTMLIIFVAHLPANSWNAFIPARFGFSSGAELFVFCSGIASALAFGSVFVRRGLALGTARIAYRIWQVYWAQLGLVLAIIALAGLLDRAFGLAELARQFGPLVVDPEGALFGLVALTWQPDYLDILPMYLVILALVPVMMALRRLHPALPFALSGALYALAWTRGLNLPGNPWNGAGWFLNPFAWQLIFFIGFFTAMTWLPVPQLRDRRLVPAAAAFIVLCLPLSFWGILEHWPAAQGAARPDPARGREEQPAHPARVALPGAGLSGAEPDRALSPAARPRGGPSPHLDRPAIARSLPRQRRAGAAARNRRRNGWAQRAGHRPAEPHRLCADPWRRGRGRLVQERALGKADAQDGGPAAGGARGDRPANTGP